MSAAGKMDMEWVISSAHAVNYYKNVNNMVSDPITQNSVGAVTPLKGNTFINLVMRKNEPTALPGNPGWKCFKQLWIAL